MTNELKPCPLCGSTDVGFGEGWKRNIPRGFYVCCNKCGCSTQLSIKGSKKAAAAKWNTRALLPSAQTIKDFCSGSFAKVGKREAPQAPRFNRKRAARTRTSSIFAIQCTLGCCCTTI